MRTPIRRGLAAVFTAAALTACQDLGTLPADLDGAPSAQSVEAPAFGGATSGFSDYVCYISMATPGGKQAYRYGRIPLRFPAAAVHPANATHRYRYRKVDAAGKILRVANCVIPRSDLAAEMMNRRFGVPEQDGELQIQGCVSGGVCTLEPIVVDGGGSGGCDPYLEADWSCDDGGGPCMTSVSDPAGDLATVQGCETGGGGPGGGTGGGTGGDGGGTNPDPGDPDSWDDGTGRPECERDANGHCITRVMTLDEWSKLAQRINAIREDIDYCKGAKDALRSFYAQGRESQRLRVWDGFDKESPTTQRYGQNLTDAQGKYIEYDSYWIWNDAFLVVHEGIHAWLAENPDNSGLVNRPDGMTNEEWVHSVDQNCV